MDKPELPGQSIVEIDGQAGQSDVRAAQIDGKAVNELPGKPIISEMNGQSAATELAVGEHPIEMPDTSLPRRKGERSSLVQGKTLPVFDTHFFSNIAEASRPK
jgi:hypothetical protein